MDTDKWVRQVQEQAMDGIKAHFRERIETVYCPDHGQFAALTEIRGDLTSGDRLEFKYTTCCEAQREQVQLMLAGDGG